MTPISVLDLTLEQPAENLALDEALLEAVERGELPPTLRFWESASPFVVLGLGCRLAEDVHEERCAEDRVPILRRSSGGGTVLQGPGSLSYALVFPMDYASELRSITDTNRFVIERMAGAFRDQVPTAGFQGISDLSIDDRKVSGNAQRRKKHALLFHGTFLYDFSATEVSRYLKLPPRRPEYRGDRPHEGFLTNLPFTAEEIKQRVNAAWNAVTEVDEWPRDRLAHFVEEVRKRSGM